MTTKKLTAPQSRTLTTVAAAREVGHLPFTPAELRVLKNLEKQGLVKTDGKRWTATGEGKVVVWPERACDGCGKFEEDCVCEDYPGQRITGPAENSEHTQPDEPSREELEAAGWVLCMKPGCTNLVSPEAKATLCHVHHPRDSKPLPVVDSTMQLPVREEIVAVVQPAELDFLKGLARSLATQRSPTISMRGSQLMGAPVVAEQLPMAKDLARRGLLHWEGEGNFTLTAAGQVVIEVSAPVTGRLTSPSAPAMARLPSPGKKGKAPVLVPEVVKPEPKVEVSVRQLANGNLMAAHNEWATRPADERFWTVDELATACERMNKERRVERVSMKELAVDEQMRLLVGKEKAAFTNWAFGQICHKADLPAHFLRTLPRAMAADILRYGLSDRLTPAEKEKTVRMSFRGERVESFTSEKFAFIPNHRIAEGLRVMEGLGWKVPPARPAPNGLSGITRLATKEDVARVGSLVKVGDPIAPAGLYASDRDLFAFMVNEDQTVDDGSGKNPLRRGFFVSNSEVGAGAWKLTLFLYDHVCGNHIVWGASQVVQLRIRHIGEEAPSKAFAALSKELGGWDKDERRKLTDTMKAARKMLLGDTREAIAEKLVCEKRLYVGKSDALRAFDLATEMDSDRVDPRSVWGMIAGFTRLSQQETHADRRDLLDRTGAGLMKLVDPNAQCGIQRARS